VRGEVPYDRVRGREGALVDQPNTSEEAIADAEWVLQTYEPRVDIESIEANPEAAFSGEFSMLVNIKRKEAEEEWPTSTS
jgi:phage baseplate assembly protein W